MGAAAGPPSSAPATTATCPVSTLPEARGHPTSPKGHSVLVRPGRPQRLRVSAGLERRAAPGEGGWGGSRGEKPGLPTEPAASLLRCRCYGHLSHGDPLGTGDRHRAFTSITSSFSCIPPANIPSPPMTSPIGPPLHPSRLHHLPPITPPPPLHLAAPLLRPQPPHFSFCGRVPPAPCTLCLHPHLLQSPEPVTRATSYAAGTRGSPPAVGGQGVAPDADPPHQPGSRGRRGAGLGAGPWAAQTPDRLRLPSNSFQGTAAVSPWLGPSPPPPCYLSLLVSSAARPLLFFTCPQRYSDSPTVPTGPSDAGLGQLSVKRHQEH